MKTKIIRVYGRVQGVGYRAFTKRQAENLGINGLVKNLSDGSVYIEASGDEDNLQSFIKNCMEGPAWSHVNNVNIEESETKSHYGFQIAR